jgi:hypothetical protein
MRTLLLTLSLLLSPNAAPEDKAPAPADPIPALRPLAALVGPKWVADFPGGKLSDTQIWSWAYDGKFLRSVHEVKDAEGRVVYGGETIYGWDAREEHLTWFYFNATGGIVTGTLEPDVPDVEGSEGRWRIAGENHGPADQLQEVRGLMAIEGDGWSSTSFALKDGEWREQAKLVFRPAE